MWADIHHNRLWHVTRASEGHLGSWPKPILNDPAEQRLPTSSAGSGLPCSEGLPLLFAPGSFLPGDKSRDNCEHSFRTGMIWHLDPERFRHFVTAITASDTSPS
jgi:hypothetical protein